MKPSKQDVDSALDGLERLHGGEVTQTNVEPLPDWISSNPEPIQGFQTDTCIVCQSPCKPIDKAILICSTCDTEVGEVLVPALWRAYAIGRKFGHDVTFNSFHAIATRQSEECAKLRQQLHDARQSALAVSEDHLSAVKREHKASGELVHEKDVSGVLFWVLLAENLAMMAWWLLR